MKAFVAVALLVATVAAGPLDLLRKDNSIYNGQYYGKIGGLNHLPLSLNTVRGDVDYVNRLPLLERLGGVRQYQQYQVDGERVYTIEELYNTEIFREYLAIPLFRQYLEYPVFQRYITSPLFQQYFVNRQFQEYFRNPVLFYKYIYPQIQYIAQEYRQVDVESTLPSVYGDRVANVDYDVLRRQYEGVNTGSLFDIERRGIFGQQYTRQNVNNVEIKYLLEKIYRDLLLNKNTVTEVVTDVKVLPKERVVDQIVEPIVGDVKIVDGQVVRVPEVVREYTTPVERTVEDRIVRDALVKDLNRIYLNKNVQDVYSYGKVQYPYTIYNRPTTTYETLNRGIQL